MDYGNMDLTRIPNIPVNADDIDDARAGYSRDNVFLFYIYAQKAF